MKDWPNISIDVGLALAPGFWVQALNLETQSPQV
jgi:hypothetical protein